MEKETKNHLLGTGLFVHHSLLSGVIRVELVSDRMSYTSVHFTRYCMDDQLRIMRWAGHLARMGKGRGVYRVLMRKPEGKRPFGRPRVRWEDNIKMDLQEVGCGDMDWIDLAHDRDRRRALVNAVMNLRVP